MHGLFFPFCFRAVMQGAPPALHHALHCACTEHVGSHVAAQMQACTSIHHTEQTQHKRIPKVPPRHTWQAGHVQSIMQEVAVTLYRPHPGRYHPHPMAVCAL
jgi:hypothetical protein